MDDWNTLSLKIASSTGSTHIVQRSIKEISLRAAIDLKDLEILVEGGRSKDGLVNAELRREIWPKLLESVQYDQLQWEELVEHKDESQIGLDVDRSFVNYPLTISSDAKSALRLKLKQILVRFFRNYPELSYYQGLHDICSAILLVLEDESSTYTFFSHFALRYLRDFMLPTIDSSIMTLKIIPELLKTVDKEFYELLGFSKDDEPYFCLSPIITLFAHDLKTLDSLSLIFDQVLCYGSLEVIFIFYVILLIEKKTVILEKLDCLSEEDDINSKDLIHNILSRLLDNTSSFDINDALNKIPIYIEKHPLSKLKSFKNLNKYSVLKIDKLPNISFEELIKLQIKESGKVSLGSSIITKLKTHIIPLHRAQIIKLSLTIGIISIIINLFFQRKDPIFLRNSFFNFSRLYIKSAFIQPFKECWDAYKKI